MISLESLLLFVAASVALAATPGPNVALIVGTSLKHGARAGVVTATGVNAGVILQLALVAVGLTYVVEAFSHHFDLVRYAGAAYLAYLAIRQWRAAGHGESGPPPSGRAAFGQGFAVAFANPKTLLFHAAFLPQFVVPTADPAPQIALLAAIFAVIALASDTLWALLADRARAAVAGRFARIADKVSAGILMGGAMVLLAAGRR